jgi:hypothetical protein
MIELLPAPLPSFTASGVVFNGDSSCTIGDGDRVIGPIGVTDETQGWVACRLHWGYASGALPHATVVHMIFGDNTTNRLTLTTNATQHAMGRLSANVGASVNLTHGGFSSGAATTIIGTWTAVELKISKDGAAFIGAANSSIPVLATPTFDLGTGGTLFANLESNNPYYWVAMGTGTLSDANAATIHALGDTDPALSSLPSTPTMIWSASGVNYQDVVSAARPPVLRVGSRNGIT